MKSKPIFFIKSIHQHTVKLFYKLILRNHWTLKILDELDDKLDLEWKNTWWTTLLNSEWFYGILDLDLISAQTT